MPRNPLARFAAFLVLLALVALSSACADGEARRREPPRQPALPTTVTRAPTTTSLPSCADVGGHSSTEHPDCEARLPVNVGGTFTLPRGLLSRTYFADFAGSGHVLFVGTGYDRISAGTWVEVDIGSRKRKILASSRNAAGHPLLRLVLVELGLR